MLKRTHSRRSGSHVRTKQSKWLDQSLQDMEHNVQHVLKLIQEDGDSFAKRAEMYYKKRPELVNFVEESYRAYRALAERYEHLTTELQNANSTLASIFPEQFQVPNDEDDDLPSRTFPQFPIPAANTSNIPKVSKPLNKEWKSLNSAAKQLHAKFSSNSEADDAQKSLSKSEALEEVDKLQNDILALQTVKEFVKCSYQSGLSRYWGIENQIIEMQLRVSNLQDEFCLNKVTGNHQVRTLMAEAALKSCQAALTQLQEKQEKNDQESRKEKNKIDDAREKLNSIRLELLNDQACEKDKGNDKNSDTEDTKNLNSEVSEAAKDREDNETASKKNQETIEAGSQASVTLTVLAEKIDNLVNTVLGLGTTVSNQTILIEKLKTETDDLHSQIRALEEDKANLINDTDYLRSVIKKLEEQLNNVEKLNQDVQNQCHNCKNSLLEACSSLDHLSEKLSNVIPDHDEDEEEEEEMSFKVEKEFAEESEKVILCDAKGISETSSQIKGIVERKEQDYNTVGYIGERTVKEIQGRRSPIQTNVVYKSNPYPITEIDNGHELNWLQMLLSGVEDREDLLLSEYTTILRKYKEAKNKLNDMEKEKKHNKFEVTLHARELKSAILKRDEQIQRLRQTANKDNMGEEKNNSDDLYVPSIVEEDEDIKCILQDQPKGISPIEEKFRMEIDTILDENLDYMLRYSISHQQIQKFKCASKDLSDQIEKLKEKRMQDGSIAGDMKSEIKAIHNHLREIQTELTVWLDQSVLLKDELDIKFSSLCNIHEKIMDTLKEGIEEEGTTFSSHQAAKFQGEILNMKQENNKIREQLEGGIDLVTTLQLEIKGILRKLKEVELSGDQIQLRYSTSQARIPLHSFIFGTKKKKHKSSIFSRMLSKRSRS